MVEEQKKTVNEDEGEQFFIDEDQFENVIPEFGTCGGGDDDQATEAKVSKVTEEEKVEEATVAAPMKNPCYKCKEKPAKYQNKMDVVC